MLERKLGLKNAAIVLKAMEKDPIHFDFIKGKVSQAELADLTTLYCPAGLAAYLDTFSFRAGIWMVLIINHHEWIDVVLVDPYNLSENWITSATVD